MKTNYTQYEKELLQDPELVRELEEAIIAKNNEYEAYKQCRKDFLSANHYDAQDDFGRYFLEKVFDTLLEGQEIERIERDLTNLCFAIRSTKSNGIKSKWVEAYERAIYGARIEEVVARYFGEKNWNRSMKCPFHEDRSPSLKIYTKTNSFFCFGCNAHGAPVNFVMLMENCDFKTAVSKLSI